MNKKMIVYILGKMLGTEGLLLLIPAVVSLLYKEKTGVYFLVVAAVLFALYLGLGRKSRRTNRSTEGRLCDRWTCVDFMVVVRSASVLFVGLYSELY